MVTITNLPCMIYECTNIEEKQILFKVLSTLHRIKNQSDFLTEYVSP